MDARRGLQSSSPRVVRRVRHLVASAILADAGIDAPPGLRKDVIAFVDERIDSMPAHLGAGILAVEVLLALGTAIAGRVPAHTIHRWETSPIPPVAQYVRLIRSLVLLSAYELAPMEEEVR